MFFLQKRTNFSNYFGMAQAFLLLIFFCANMFFLSASSITAQTPKKEILIFNGVVTGVQGTTVQVLNGALSFDVSTSKLIDGSTGKAILPSAITVGSVFVTEGPIAESQSTPSKPELAQVILPENGSIGGVFKSMDMLDVANQTITINNQKITIDNETRIFGPSDVKIEKFEDFTKLKPNFHEIVMGVKLLNSGFIAKSVFVSAIDGTFLRDSGAGYVTDVKPGILEIFGGRISINIADFRAVQAQATGQTLDPNSSLKGAFISFVRDASKSANGEIRVHQPNLAQFLGRYNLQKVTKSNFLAFNTQIFVDKNTEYLIDGVLAKGNKGVKLLKKKVGTPIIVIGKIMQNKLFADTVDNFGFDDISLEDTRSLQFYFQEPMDLFIWSYLPTE
ncbi:MAG: hypothetical protein HY819_23490 [Acidobacteria bacterium]|nr:hypothetical protein [Acidobacteriota bacterium]